jgi:O-methyltransferase
MTTIATDYRSLITPDRMENLLRAVDRTRDVPGDMAELGVYRGGSAKAIADACPDKMLHLFDTFTGLPYTELSKYDPKGLLTRGDFRASAMTCRAVIGDRNVRLYPGFFPNTTCRVRGVAFSFVHIDCDLHQSAVDAIEWFWPRMSEGGILYVDDYGCEFTGVTEAVNAAFSPEQIELQYDVHGFQIGALVVKR